MKKGLKIAIRIILIALAVLLLFIGVTYIVHRIKTNEEREALKNNGLYNPVSLGDYSLNVAQFGDGDVNHTIVVMAGLGMGDCSVSMQKMLAPLEDENLIVFVDRAGYGLSDDTSDDMTLERIVEDYRKALNNAGIKGPYILLPHSIGGAYATYWCSQYPDEIEAVIFVDGSQLSETAFDENADEYKSAWSDSILSFFAKLGFSRFALRNYFYKYPDIYTEEEQYLGDALALLTLDSKATISECNYLVENAQKAFKTIITNDIPKLYISSSWGFDSKEDWIEYIKWVNKQIDMNNLGEPMDENPSDESINKILQQFSDQRQNHLIPYLEKMGNCELVLLGGDHMIYEQKPDECGKIIKEFISGLDE